MVPMLKDFVQKVDNTNEQIGIQQMETKKKEPSENARTKKY